MTTLKRFGGELIILIGLLIISLAFQNISILVIAIPLTIVSVYDLVQIVKVNKQIKSSNSQVNGEERLSAYREKELLHILLKKIITVVGRK